MKTYAITCNKNTFNNIREDRTQWKISFTASTYINDKNASALSQNYSTAYLTSKYIGYLQSYFQLPQKKIP